MTCTESSQLAAVADVIERDITMRDLLLEQLEHLRGVFADVETLFDGLGSFEDIDFNDDVHREACAFAYGYLRGAAEMTDVTVGTLLEEHDLPWNEPAPKRSRKPRPRCPVCGGKTHRCKTGGPGCLHCDDCTWVLEHATRRIS